MPDMTHCIIFDKKRPKNKKPAGFWIKIDHYGFFQSTMTLSIILCPFLNIVKKLEFLLPKNAKFCKNVKNIFADKKSNFLKIFMKGHRMIDSIILDQQNPQWAILSLKPAGFKINFWTFLDENVIMCIV